MGETMKLRDSVLSTHVLIFNVVFIYVDPALVTQRPHTIFTFTNRIGDLVINLEGLCVQML